MVVILAWLEVDAGAAIYGNTDDRKDLWEVTDPAILQMARSTAILLPASELQPEWIRGVFAATAGRGLGRRERLCASERFFEQTSLSARACSGALIAPDRVLTAGHCVPSAEACRELAVVFGFGIETEGAVGEEGVDPQFGANDIYFCRRLLSPSYLGRADEQPDFAVIQLDRRVSGREPLRGVEGASSRGEVVSGTPLMTIGHPSGLPTKVTDGGEVTYASAERNYFFTDLDTFAGNSGSPVFDAANGRIVGVLVDGERDYEESRNGSCRVSSRNPIGFGEKVTSIRSVLPYLR